MFATALTLLAVLLASGTFSSLMFVYEWSTGAPSPLVASLVLLAVAAVAVTIVVSVTRRAQATPVHVGIAAALLVITGVLATYWMARHAQLFPHGETDAWAIWNSHAKFMYWGADGSWRRLFSPDMAWFHPDYPMLLPGLISGLWTVRGTDSPVVPQTIGYLYAIVPVGIVSAAVSALWKDDRGFAAGLILLATPAFLMRAASQYGDLPIGAYMLATVALIRFADAWPRVRTTLLALAGLSAGLAAWTKNEGLLFLVVVVAVLGVRAFHRSTAWTFRDLAVFCGGAAPMLALLGAFKVLLAPPSDIVGAPSSLARALIPARYLEISTTFVLSAREFGRPWNRYTHPFLLLGAYLAVYSPFRRTPAWTIDALAFVPMLMIVGYFMVYVITPLDLTWHMATSMERLLLQVWPTAVFVIATHSVPATELNDSAAMP